jgi:two-component system cell cycle response regulator
MGHGGLMQEKLLVIDDSQAVHALVRARLREENLQVVSAFDGERGIEQARREQPDVILLDVDMPHPDGFEVCRRLKSESATMAIPVIFLSGAGSSDSKTLGLDLGAIDYVTKPFDPAELRARVRAALRMKRLMDLLSQKAKVDGLTGLWNRAHFDERMVAAVATARRHKQPLSLMMMDADRFKSINDRYGHPFGDEVLRSIAARLTQMMRLEDIVCRFGGEEFAIVLPHTALEGARQLAERIRTMIMALELVCKGQRVEVTCSFGVAELQSLGANADMATLVQAADEAMYAAKKNGRNRVEVAGKSTATSAAGRAPVAQAGAPEPHCGATAPATVATATAEQAA